MNNLKESDPFSKKHFTELNFLATLFVFLGGCILLYIALFDINLETEIALT